MSIKKITIVTTTALTLLSAVAFASESDNVKPGHNHKSHNHKNHEHKNHEHKSHEHENHEHHHESSVKSKSSDSFYFVLGGAASPTKYSFSKLGKKNSGTKVAGEFLAGLGSQFNENIRADLTLGFMPETEFSKNKDALGVIKLQSLTALANVYYHFEDFSGFSPYVTVGMGVTRNKISSDTEGFNGKRTGFSWQGGLGVSKSINEDLTLDVGYRFADKGKVLKKSSVNVKELRNHLLLASVRISL